MREHGPQSDPLWWQSGWILGEKIAAVSQVLSHPLSYHSEIIHLFIVSFSPLQYILEIRDCSPFAYDVSSAEPILVLGM